MQTQLSKTEESFAPRGANPDTSQLERLRKLVFDYQEVSKDWELDGDFKGISDPELCHRSGLSWSRFKELRDKLLADPDSGLIRTPSGGLALTW